MQFSFFVLVCLVTTTSSQITEGNPGCGADSYFGPFGAISSPNYPGDYGNLLDCDYNVFGSAESSLSFIFSSFHVESLDFVTISCPANSSFLPQSFSGHTLPNPVSIPWCSHGLVQFHTDNSAVSSGFSLDYYVSEGGCGETLFTEVYGNVTSPGWPDYYGYNQNCLNIIWVLQQSTTHLHFRIFSLEDCNNCECDWLEIRCLDNPAFTPAKYCGDYSNYMTYIYQCSQVLLWFNSDAANNYQGFHISYNIYEDGGCGATIYDSPYGVITSPNYPENYPENMNCNYDVIGSSDSSILFIFESFNTEPGLDLVTISCASNSSFPPQQFSGHSLPAPVSLPWCSLGRVNFFSDFSISYTGFSLDYSVSFGGCGNTLFNGSHGYVTSPSYPAYYGDDQDCANIIWAPQRSHFHLEFLFIDVQACGGACTCDWVEISCLDNNPSEKYRFCGDVESSLDFYQCTRVLVWFHSDITAVYPGFNLEYNVVPEAETTGVTGSTSSPQTATNPSSSSSSSSSSVASSSPDTTNVPETTTAVESSSTTQSPVTTVTPDTTSVSDTTGFVQTTSTPPVTTDTIDPVCGETSYYGPTGVISSPNYPLPYDRNLDCNYYVYASNGSSLSFIFKSFQTEANHDFVTISCPSDPSFEPRIFHGQPALLDPVSIPWCSQGLVNFRSDESDVDRGFILTYYVSDGGCGNTVYTNSTGFLMSPNWPSDYGNDQSCLNIIWTSERSTFSFDFLSFFLDSCCSCDWLEISCLDNSEYGPYKYCGTYIYDVVYMNQCRQALLWFRSDSSLTNQGFHIQYKISPEAETPRGTNNIPPPAPTPRAGCGNLSYNGSFGVITSPNYPGSYENSLECQYNIYATPDSSIALVFEHFDVQDDKDYIRIKCETNSSFEEQTYSGHALPPPLSIPWCSQASIYFFTDTSTVYSGFSLDYHVSRGGCGNTVYTGSAGNISSPNYPMEYNNDQDCYNIITAPQPSHFHLQYLDFSVEGSEPCSLDWVEISCLDNNPSNQHRFCGDTIYPLDLYQCTQVLVWFHTNIVTNDYYGFNLEYHVYPESGCGESSFYGPSGVITSPNYPDYYNNSIYCDYSIFTLSSSGSIAIIFEAFSTEKCCDFVTISCPTNSSYTSLTYSGYMLPTPISVPWCSQGRVSFGTDNSVVSPGFYLDYYVSSGGCGNTIYTEIPGYISSPNYPSSYGNNQNCSSIIWSDKQADFSISFLYINVEPCCDFVELTCLDNPAYGNHRFNVTTPPPTQTIPQCSQVLVWFFSDLSTTFGGFNLSYSVIPGSEIHSG